MTDVVTLERGAEALGKLVPAWESLAAQALEPNPFFEQWLLLPALRAFAAEGDARVARGKAVGAAPLPTRFAVQGPAGESACVLAPSALPAVHAAGDPRAAAGIPC